MKGFATQAEIDAGLAAYNGYFAKVWDARQGEIQARLSRVGRDLVRQEERVQEVEDISLELSSPPRLDFTGATHSAGRMKVVFALPGSGSWDLGIRARIRVLPWTRRGSLIKVRIKRLRASAEITIDRRSPIEASLEQTRVAVRLEDVDIDASNFVVRHFARGLSFLLDVVEDLVENLVRDALRGSLPDAGAIRAQQELGLASRPPAIPENPAPLDDLVPAAEKVSQRIHDHHLPFGTLLGTLVPRNNPDGGPSGYRQFEDSAIWTGHFLAGEIYRHKVTQDPKALENIKRGLDGFRQLIHLTDDAGLLSRVAIPHDKPDFVQALDAERITQGQEERLFTSSNGGYRGIGHITRDQYIGAFLGVGWVALRVGDEELRAEAREIASEMVEYLVERLFCPTEAAADPETGVKFTSVTYLQSPVQILAILQFARRLDAEKYTALYDKLYPMWSVQWLFQWLQSIDPHDSYFKFNSEHASALLLLALEDEPERHARLALGFRIVRQAVKNHGNAYFNLIELETLGNNPELLSRPREELSTEAHYLLRQAFKRAPLIENIDLAEDPELDLVEIGGTSSADDRTQTISRQPVDVMHRPGADFIWQHSPFNLRAVWPDPPDNPAPRSPNVDLVLPFWIARKVGL